MKNIVSFEEILIHKDNFRNSDLKLTPGFIYKGGNRGNITDEQLSHLMRVGNAGGMRAKNNKYGETAYVVLTITHKNNNWDDKVNYEENSVIYYGDNRDKKNIYNTKHKGNCKLKFLYDNLSKPEKQFPLFLFERDEDCINKDFKYIGIVVLENSPEGLVKITEIKNGQEIENYKARLILTKDTIDFNWIEDLIEGISPLESEYCPKEWKSILCQNKYSLISEDSSIKKILEEGNENWKQETIVEYSEVEGKKKKIFTTKYERNPKIRKKAIEIHGSVCQICGFDFEKTYGKIGKGFIEVHHKVPLSDLDNEVRINPETDLICVCSNCHRMLHRRRDMVLDAEELKTMIKVK